MVKINGLSMSSSRVNKQQVIAFLSQDQSEKAYLYAQANDFTNQEVIGHAINVYLNSKSLGDWFLGGHSRVIRRGRGKSKTRKETAPACRQEKRSFSGWFDKQLVSELRDLSSKLGVPIQEIIEQGVYLLTEKN